MRWPWPWVTTSYSNNAFDFESTFPSLEGAFETRGGSEYWVLSSAGDLEKIGESSFDVLESLSLPLGTGVALVPNHWPHSIAVSTESTIFFYSFQEVESDFFISSSVGAIQDIEYDPVRDVIIVATASNGIWTVDQDKNWNQPSGNRFEMNNAKGLKFVDMGEEYDDMLQVRNIFARLDSLGDQVGGNQEAVVQYDQGTTNIDISGIALTNSYQFHTYSETSGARFIFRYPKDAFQFHLEPEVDPAVFLTSPIDSTVENENNTISFGFNATDNTLIWTCSLVLNGAVTDTFPATKDTPLEFEKTLEDGIYNWQISCTDVWNNTGVSETRTLTIILNQPPVLEPIGPRILDEGTLLEILLNASDADGDNLTFATNAADVLPSEFFFNNITGYFAWTPTDLDAGIYNVTFGVTDTKDSDSEEVTIIVNDVGTCEGGVNEGDPCDPANGNADCEDGVNNGECVPAPAIPAASSWGLAVLALLTLTAGSLLLSRNSV